MFILLLDIIIQNDTGAFVTFFCHNTLNETGAFLLMLLLIFHTQKHAEKQAIDAIKLF